VFENSVLRKIFGPKRDEVDRGVENTIQWGRHALYYSPNIVRVIKSRRMGWMEHVARMGDRRETFEVLVGRPEGRRPFGRPSRRWEDNTKMDLQEVGWRGMEWIAVA
jgi:hypothetical protein